VPFAVVAVAVPKGARIAAHTLTRSATFTARNCGKIRASAANLRRLGGATLGRHPRNRAQLLCQGNDRDDFFCRLFQINLLFYFI
jgi:hypothetical protein